MSLGRRRRGRRRCGRALVAVVAVALVAPACGGGDEAGAPATTTVPVGGEAVALVADAAEPVSPLVEADGAVLYAERRTGRVRRVDPDGRLDPEPVAEVAVVAGDGDQRGLLGLARLPDGALVVAATRAADGRLVVEQVAPERRLVWEGPSSADLANGGHLAVAADGSLLLGVGDLQEDRALADDPDVANRKVLALDPAGPPDQEPEVLSTGWNNPFALAVAADGTPWVADNSPGPDEPERVGRADRPAADAAALEVGDGGQVAPSGLADLDDGRLALCGYLAGAVLELAVEGGTAEPTGRVLARPCATGVAVLADGRLVTTTLDAVWVTGRPVVAGG